jgi:hypothetical protein
MALVTCLCWLPAPFLVNAAAIAVLASVNAAFGKRIDKQAWTTGPSLLDQVLNSIGYAVFSSLTYAVLTIFAVTLLSLTYRFFVVPDEEGAARSA